MNIEEYLQLSANTQASSRPALLRSTDDTMDLVHIGFGLAGEVGEFVDAVKKHLFYGKELDRTNLIEELGDIMWFWAYACRALQVHPHEVLDLNIKKLAARYPKKFEESMALNRDLDKERQILEGN